MGRMGSSGMWRRCRENANTFCPLGVCQMARVLTNAILYVPVAISLGHV